jgi:hypothetical protein
MLRDANAESAFPAAGERFASSVFPSPCDSVCTLSDPASTPRPASGPRGRRFESCLPDSEGRGRAREKRAFRGLRHCRSHFRRRTSRSLRRGCPDHGPGTRAITRNRGGFQGVEREGKYRKNPGTGAA